MTETLTMASQSQMLMSMSFPVAHKSDSTSGRCPTHQGGGWSWSDIPCGGFVEEVPWKLPTSIDNNADALSSPFQQNPTALLQDNYKAATMELASSSLPCRKASHHRHVSFAPIVQIRTHELIAGDHPCCKDGLALECGWEIVLEQQVERTTSTSSRRMANLLLTPKERWYRLHGAESGEGAMKLGFSRANTHRDLAQHANTSICSR